MIFLLSVLITVLSVLPAAARQAQPADFAYAVPVTITGDNALNRFPLPETVYRAVTRNDLSDMCMFNGANEPIPFRIQQPHTISLQSNETRTLPFFPLSGSQEAIDKTLDLQIRKDAHGALIRMSENRTARKQLPAAYLIDASGLHTPIAALVLHSDSRQGEFVSTARLEGSNNLNDWQLLTDGATIIRLRYGSNTLQQQVIPLESPRYAYYRLSVVGSTIPLVTHIEGVVTQSGRYRLSHWIETSPVLRQSHQGEYQFDTGGSMPVSQVRLRLPQQNTLAKVSFYSRRQPGDPWRMVGQALVYRLVIKGHEVQNGEIPLTPTTDRYRLMRVALEGGGLGNGNPTVQWGWQPALVLFVARGNAPYAMAYGNGRGIGCTQQSDELFSGLSATGAEQVITDAVPGKQYALAGERAKRDPLGPDNGKTALLWTLLVLAVIILGGMAFTLIGQLSSRKTHHLDQEAKEKDQTP